MANDGGPAYADPDAPGVPVNALRYGFAIALVALYPLVLSTRLSEALKAVLLAVAAPVGVAAAAVGVTARAAVRRPVLCRCPGYVDVGGEALLWVGFRAGEVGIIRLRVTLVSSPTGRNHPHAFHSRSVPRSVHRSADAVRVRAGRGTGPTRLHGYLGDGGVRTVPQVPPAPAVLQVPPAPAALWPRRLQAPGPAWMVVVPM